MSKRIFPKVLLVVVAVFGLLVLSNVLSAQGLSQEAFERVREVQERHTNWLMAMEGVEGTAIGLNENDRLAIKVFTAGPGVAGIPKTLDGVPVQVVVTGKFYALAPGGKPGKPTGKPDGEEKVDPTARFPRPVPIGVSTGNAGACSAGTIGCRVKDSDGNVYALSNNHVYALENTAEINSEVLQPGLYDTHCSYDVENVIGTLDDYVKIWFGDPAIDWQYWTENTIDAAIAVINFDDNGPLVGNATPLDGYGTPSSVILSPEDVNKLLDEPVQKYGQRTSLTKGTITAVNLAVRVGYSSGTARFVGQIVIIGTRDKFSNAGDSGSLIVTQDNNSPVGLLFAGGGPRTIANPIDEVLGAFGVTIDGTLDDTP